MCKVITIENIISSYFLAHKSDKKVDVSTLNEYKSELENNLSPKEFVYVDNTRDAWLNAMNHNRDLFRIVSSTDGNDTLVELRVGYEKLKQCEGYFNARLPFQDDNERKKYKAIFIPKGSKASAKKRKKVGMAEACA
jgi:hypothetical protein